MPRNSIGILFARARTPKTSSSAKIVERYYLWMGVILHGPLVMRGDGIAGVSGVRERNVRPSSDWVFYTATYTKRWINFWTARTYNCVVSEENIAL